ncbi:phage tail tip fiber protein, partial [Pseudomonas faucium]|uniref:phage tail tip fiber protein n=1 Tax=Pseudomonas faucium TaxID=2740518 RepID=UPI001F3E7EF9
IAFYANSFCGLNPDVITAPGEQFDVSADVFRDFMTAGQTGNFQMQFYDKAGASLGYIAAFAFSAGGSFQKFSGRITAPSGAVSARFLTRLMPVDGVGRSVWCNIIARRVTAADTANADAVSTLSSTVTQQGTTIISQGQALTALTNRVTDAEGVNSAQASAISQIDTTVKSQGDSLTAQAQRLDGIYVQVNPPLAGADDGLAGSERSLVGAWSEQSARIEDGIATGKRIDTVQSQVGDVSASVQMVSQTVAGVDGRVSAMTTIKAQTTTGGRKVMAGLALGSDGETGEILAFAQRFAIVDESSGQMTLPFVVS